MDLIVPSYQLSDDNVFNLRHRDWKDQLVSNITKMFQHGDKYNIRLKEITLTKDTSRDQAEIKKTLSRVLRVVVNYGDNNKDLELVYDVPWLVDNHFFIGGNKKISIFQLYDMPVIRRDDTIKIRTNINTFNLTRKSKRRNNYNFFVTVNNKEVPFCKVVAAYKGFDSICDDFEINPDGSIKDSVTGNQDYFDFLTDLATLATDPLINRDRLLADYFTRREDSEIITSVLLVTDIDIFSRSFMKTDNVIDELIYVLKENPFIDLNYDNKRIRFSEQLVYSHLCKDFYTMFLTILRSSRKSRYCNNSKVILSTANTSPIVQFDFSINPLAELAMLTRLSLSGPGGFEKSNVPSYLRDIHPSMFGRVCPADTGDRENCGTIQFLVPTIDFDDNLQFATPKEDCINSIAISHVPFLEHDDATRLQMASSQQRHAIMLKEFDSPKIQSGIEGMYTENTSFIFKAERDGKVVYRDANVIIIQYDNKECKAFNIGYKKLFLSVCDFYHTYFDIEEEFKKGDIIAESNFLSNGRLTIGKNLLTAVMVYYGYNYEDGIVISQKLVDDGSLTSLHYLDLTFEVPPNKLLMNLDPKGKKYKPLPEVGDRLSRGDIYAKIKTITGLNDSHDVLFDDAQERSVYEDCVIVDVKIFANSWNKSFPEYRDYIQGSIDSKKDEKLQMIDNLSKYLTQDELESFLESIEIDRTEKRSNRGTYKIKGDSIDGIRVEITAIYERPVSVGDKIGNRHGNKGIISKIVPEEDMPALPDGRKAEVIVNPLGIVSRMNIGQLFELHLSSSMHDLHQEIIKELEGKENLKKLPKSVIDRIMGYIQIIDNSADKSYTSQMQSYLNEVSVKDFLGNDFYVIQPPFESVKIEQLIEAMAYTDTPFEYPVYDPTLDDLYEKKWKKNIKNTIAFGYMYFIKMNHISKDKIASRGVGPYASKTAQPLDGKSRKGGQRLGEMEVWAIAAHGATINLQEMLTTKSDSIKLRNRYISKMINNEDIVLEEEDVVSQSNRLFQSKLKTMGLDYLIMEDD